MELKWSITAGELLQILVILLGAFGLYNRVCIQIAKIEARLDPVVTWWQKQMELEQEFTVRHWKKENGGD